MQFFLLIRIFPAYLGGTLRSRALFKCLSENADSGDDGDCYCDHDLQGPVFGQAEV